MRNLPEMARYVWSVGLEEIAERETFMGCTAVMIFSRKIMRLAQCAPKVAFTAFCEAHLDVFEQFRSNVGSRFPERADVTVVARKAG